jgi:hypothetical protein
MLSLVWKQVTRSTSPAASTCDRRPLRLSVCLRFWIGSFTLKCLLWERVGGIGCRVDSVECRLFGVGIEDRVKCAKSWRMMVDHGWKLIRRLDMTLSAPTWPNKGCLGNFWRLRCYKICSQAAEANTLDGFMDRWSWLLRRCNCRMLIVMECCFLDE